MVLEIDIIANIAEKYALFTKAERKIADFTLQDMRIASQMSIGDIAEHLDISKASITRFAKSIGCKDVRHYKMLLAQNLVIGQRFISDTREIESITAVYDSITSILDINRSLLSEAVIKEATKLISQSSMVYIIGMGGGSSFCAQEMQYRLFRLGIAASFYNDSLLARMLCATVNKTDTVIFLSLTGLTPEIIECAEIVKNNKVKSISVTTANSPLSNITDVFIPIQSQETDYIYKPSSSRYALLAIIDILSTELALQNKASTREKLRKLKIALVNHRGGENRQPLGD